MKELEKGQWVYVICENSINKMQISSISSKEGELVYTVVDKKNVIPNKTRRTIFSSKKELEQSIRESL
jgi:TusA-related sulfurtransferase